MRLVRALVTAAALALLLQGLGTARADAAGCSAGTVLNVVAHTDDDLLFINPDIQSDITAGRCVRTVFVTAGDAGSGSGYWTSREAGAKAAYAQMAGVPGGWVGGTAMMAGHMLHTESLGAGPDIRLTFLRLPDGNLGGSGFGSQGNQSLQKLWQGEISTIRPVDSADSFTKDGLAQTLTAIMVAEQAGQIRTQDYVHGFGDGDHSDHHAAAFFARKAHQAFGASHTLTGYQGYPISSRPANLSAAQADGKLNTFLSYSAFDSHVCGSAAACRGDAEYAPWFSRQYVVGSEGGQPSNPTPTLTSIAPAQASAGAPAVTVTLTGSGFVPDSVARWNGQARATTYVERGAPARGDPHHGSRRRHGADRRDDAGPGRRHVRGPLVRGAPGAARSAGGPDGVRHAEPGGHPDVPDGPVEREPDRPERRLDPGRRRGRRGERGDLHPRRRRARAPAGLQGGRHQLRRDDLCDQRRGDHRRSRVAGAEPGARLRGVGPPARHAHGPRDRRCLPRAATHRVPGEVGPRPAQGRAVP